MSFTRKDFTSSAFTIETKEDEIYFTPKLLLGNEETDLHEFPDHVPADHVVEDGLELLILHQAELDPVPVPHDDLGGLQGSDGHLEVLVRADSEPLGRVEELVVADEM